MGRYRRRKKDRLLIAPAVLLVLILVVFFVKERLSTRLEAVTLETVTYETDTDFETGIVNSTRVVNTGDDSRIELALGGGPDGTAYHREVTVDNSANATNLSEYQAVINNLNTASLISAGKMQSDCGDLRFTDSDDNEIPYWVGPGTCNSTNTIVFVKTPTIPGSGTTSVNMYYGNSSVGNGQDEFATFTYSTQKVVGYHLSDELSAVSNIALMSLTDSNSITHNGNTYNLNKGDYQANLSNVQGYLPWLAKGAFEMTRGAHFSDTVTPISWAGTEYYLHLSAGGVNGIKIHTIALWGDATVNIYKGGVLACGPISVTSSGQTTECGGSGAGVYRITSTMPILMSAELLFSGGYRSKMPALPAQTGKIILSGGTTSLLNGSDSSRNYTIYMSDAVSPTIQNVAANSFFSVSNAGTNPGALYGGAPAFLVEATEAAAVHGVNTGAYDNVYGDKVENQGTFFGAPTPQSYFISVSSTYPATCTVYNAQNDSVMFTGTATSVNNDVYHLRFGSGSASVYIGPEWYMECDQPVNAFYRKNSIYETVNWRASYARQYTYPEPTTSIGSESELYVATGSWESSADESDVIDLVWNGGWGDGTLSSTAFEATLSDTSMSENVLFQIRVAEELADLESETYISLGTATSGTFTITAEAMDTLGVATEFYRYVQVRAVLTSSDDSLSPKIESFTLSYLRDDLAPATNASNAVILGAADGDWLRIEPTVVWDAGDDDTLGSGIMGYCVALDATGLSDPAPNNDPTTSAGVLNPADTEITHPSCPFIVQGEAFDLSTVASLQLQTANRYYLSVKAVDFAGNVYAGGGFQNLVSFRFDNANPKNVDYLVVPNTVFGSIDDMFFSWPSTGAAASNDLYLGDELSGVLGWQYSVNSTADWKGPQHSVELDLYYIPYDGVNFMHTLSESIDGDDIAIGNNVIYIRTVDNAGNVSSHVSGVLAYGGEAPTFPPDGMLTVTPNQSNVNSFALSWPQASAGSGHTIESYYYMINRTPPTNFATLSTNSSIYIPTTATSVEQAPLTGSIRGTNSVCVVAVDDANNYSASNVLCGEYTLNSTAPDPVQNLFVTDTSVRANQLWRATLVWEEPAYKGTGQLTYIVQRSGDGSSWVTVTTTLGLAHTDVVPESKLYYYRVGVYDTSDESIQNPTYSNFVPIIPKGSYTEPAELVSGPKVIGISTTNATISWTTGRQSDSKVQYGLTSGDYFPEEPSKGEQTNDHEIQLINLRPGTQYYFRSKWTDEDGNLGRSDEQSFTTLPAPVVIDPQVTRVGLNFATIRFTVQDASAARIYYGKTSSFGGVQEIATATSRSTYVVNIDGLDDGSKYFYRINTFDRDGNEYQGIILSFDTLPRPQVTNVRIQQVRNSAQPTVLVTWDSNTEITSVVSYYPMSEPSNRIDEVDIDLIKGEHKLLVKNLEPETQYGLVVSGTDRQGNEAISSEQIFTTATDTRPPKVTDLVVESSIVTSENGERTAQLVVSWNTDEGATSQVEYGYGNNTEYTQRTRVNTDLSVNHVVVISELQPSSVYHLRVLSQDSQGNQALSSDVVTITPKSSASALDLVIDGLRNVFGFL